MYNYWQQICCFITLVNFNFNYLFHKIMIKTGNELLSFGSKCELEGKKSLYQIFSKYWNVTRYNKSLTLAKMPTTNGISGSGLYDTIYIYLWTRNKYEIIKLIFECFRLFFMLDTKLISLSRIIPKYLTWSFYCLRKSF